MSKQRKLQLEVDSTLKKIAEGVDDWAALWGTLDQTAEQSKEREKLAEALKRDLKKLQRLRDQVRGWLASGEIKDEAPLLAGKKAIERHMESYKQLERDQKVKAFSALGLARDSLDPATLAKIRCADWLNDAATRLEAQTEALEADLEALGPVGRGKTTKTSAAASAAKAAALSARVERHREYQARIERVLRLLENDQVTAEEVEESLKDSLDYFIEAHAEDDYVHDEYMWDALPLSVVDEGVGKISAHKGGSGGSSSTLGVLGGGGKTEEVGEEDEKRGVVDVVPPTPEVGGKAELLSPEKSIGAVQSKAPVKAGKPFQTLDTNGSPQQQQQLQQQQVGEGPRVASSWQAPPPGFEMLGRHRQQEQQSSQSYEHEHEREQLPLTPAPTAESPRTPPSEQPAGFSPEEQGCYPASARSPFAAAGLEIPISHSRTGSPTALGAAAVYETTAAHGEQQQPTTAVARENISPSHPATARSQTSIEKMNGSSPFAEKSQRAFTPQPSLDEQQSSHLVPSFLFESWVPEAEAESRASVGCRMASPWEHTLLESSTQYLPIAGDGEWRKTDGFGIAGYESSWKPPHPAIPTSSSLPRNIHPALQRDGAFDKMTLETAFVAFFCQQGSAQQRLAASALEGQGWRYHTELRTWFARRGAPIEQKETHERGKMAYWDSRVGQVMPGVWGGFCLRETPPDFLIEYSKLTALS